MKNFFTSFWNKRQNKKGGFTLVETLVAVSIFTLSILGLLVVLTQGIANNNYAKRKTIATYLAQEGVEYMRNMRDTFVLFDPTDSQTGWVNFNNYVAAGFPTGSGICAQPDGCYFGDLNDDFYTDTSQPMTELPVTACTGTCPQLLYDTANAKYYYIAGVDSGYVRKINVSQISADEMKVSSTVTWSQASGSYSITFSENLFNWVE